MSSHLSAREEQLVHVPQRAVRHGEQDGRQGARGEGGSQEVQDVVVVGEELIRVHAKDALHAETMP